MPDQLLPLDPALYRETLAQLQLREVVLRELHVSCENPVTGDVKINIATDAGAVHERGELRVEAHHTISARNAKEALFTIEATYLIVMSAPDELPEGFAEVYIANNLTITVFPFVRELVASLTARMGLPPLTLPYIINQFAKEPDKPKPRSKKKKAAES